MEKPLIILSLLFIGIKLIGQAVSTDSIISAAEPKPEVFYKIKEEVPRFPGCEYLYTVEEKQVCARKKIYSFIGSYLVYPNEAIPKKVSGIVTVRFFIEKDGSLDAVEVVKDIGSGCGAEVVRVLALMQSKGLKWGPIRSRGRPLRILFYLDVHFDLNRLIGF